MVDCVFIVKYISYNVISSADAVVVDNFHSLLTKGFEQTNHDFFSLFIMF